MSDFLRKLLTREIESSGKTQKEIAAESGISEASLSKRLGGSYQIKQSHAFEILTKGLGHSRTQAERLIANAQLSEIQDKFPDTVLARSEDVVGLPVSLQLCETVPFGQSPKSFPKNLLSADPSNYYIFSTSNILDYKGNVDAVIFCTDQYKGLDLPHVLKIGNSLVISHLTDLGESWGVQNYPSIPKTSKDFKICGVIEMIIKKF